MEGIRGREQSSRRCEHCGGETAVVTGSVESLVVRAGHGGESGEERRVAHDALGVVRVQPHSLPLVGRQPRRLLPDANRDGDPADVVDERGPS